ncbi:MAG TPA: alpha/beta hydrolase [Candidatus Kapabacteria bacterium]|nr:alpha/beta hydrolase [Candidatus Kapabacteria bacterium]
MISIQFINRGEDSRALVLIHAFPLSSMMYRETASIIAERFPSLPIVLVDMPGFGNATTSASWTMSEAMNDLHAQLQDDDITSVIIGGTSMGGYAVFAYYKLFPQECAGLIFSNTKAEADDEKAKQGREEYAQAVEKGGAVVAVEKQLDALLGSTTKRQNTALYEQVKDWILATDPSAISAALRAMAVREDSTALLSTITCPTLVISAEEDTVMKEEVVSAIAKAIPSSDYHRLSSTGHLSPLEVPKEWADFVGAFINDKII